ncbi:MAG: pilus assembly protein [Dehalococcoidia bacterium]|nr:pilus assembly protein [Dehalococcoidia bacterium]
MSSFKTLLNRVRVQRGQTLIEFALIVPFVFVLLFAIVDFGSALDKRVTLQHAVREGARAAAVHADPAVAESTTVDQAQGLVSSATVCFIDGNNGNNKADALESVRVSLSYDYNYTVPFASLLRAIGYSGTLKIPMTPSATSALENDPAAGITFVECSP